MKAIQIEVKKNVDLIEALGNQVALTVKGFAKKGSMKRLPSVVRFTETKPQFHLGAGSLLYAYVIDIASGKVLADKYCGSCDSVIHYGNEHFSEGQRSQSGIAVMYVESYYNGRNHSWDLTVISEDICKQIH
jgi:hypothetical protein